MKKFYLSILMLVFIGLEAYSFSETSEVRRTAIINGIGLGTVVAAVTSWERNRSVLLMIIHGIFSWFYVIYFLLTRKRSERK